MLATIEANVCPVSDIERNAVFAVTVFTQGTLILWNQEEQKLLEANHTVFIIEVFTIRQDVHTCLFFLKLCFNKSVKKWNVGEASAY